MAQAETQKTEPQADRGIRLDVHHEKITAALKNAQAEVAEAQAELVAAERRVAERQGWVKYYQGQLDLLVEFAQFAQPQAGQDPVS